MVGLVGTPLTLLRNQGSIDHVPYYGLTIPENGSPRFYGKTSDGERPLVSFSFLKRFSRFWELVELLRGGRCNAPRVDTPLLRSGLVATQPNRTEEPAHQRTRGIPRARGRAVPQPPNRHTASLSHNRRHVLARYLPTRARLLFVRMVFSGLFSA